MSIFKCTKKLKGEAAIMLAPNPSSEDETPVKKNTREAILDFSLMNKKWSNQNEKKLILEMRR